MALTPEQRRVLAAIHTIAGQRGASPKEVKAAIETGIVESNLTNPSNGDADSQGWRQERASLYDNPTNLTASINRFFDETGRVKSKYGRAGDLAAAVQRPRSDLRGKYQLQSGRADALLRSLGSATGPAAAAAPSSTTTSYQPGTSDFTPNTDSNGAGLSDLIAAQLSGQKQQAAPAAQLADPSFSASKYVNAALPQASAAMVKPKLDVGAVISSLESSAPVSDIVSTPGKLTSSTSTDPVGLPVPRAGSSKGASAAVDFAKSRLGQYAENQGSNRGSQLDQLQARFGMKGQPWCAIFTSVAVTRGGAPKVARTASVATIRQQVDQGDGGYQHGFKGKPKAGDLMLFGNAHVGLVESVNRDGTVTTIEGNTGAGKVQRVKRAANSGDFARPKYR